MSSDGSAVARGVEVGPAPEGFRTEAVPLPETTPPGGGGVHVLLSETLYDLTGPASRTTSRLVRRVTSRDGLQAVARFDTVYDPRFERLVIHHIRVIRNGVAREVGRPEAFELMRREPNLERAMYDGRMTAHMIIPDVREGDVVDSCFSISGDQPGLQGVFGWGFVLQWSVPVAETTCRIIAPGERKLRFRRFGGAPDPEVVERGGIREYRWTAINTPPQEPEPYSPVWDVNYPAVETGDDLTWAQVADLFRPLYEAAIDAELPDDLKAEIDALAVAQPDPRDRAIAALRHVQNSLRYHSVAIGEGGYRPRQADGIWNARYGDCKDASVLLTAVLRRLGLTACCTLVHTALGRTLPDSVMGPRAFNHCIVRLTLAGEDYWLDPTCPPQAGDLAHVSQARDGWVLPLVPESFLVKTPEVPLTVVREVTETWTFPRDTRRVARLEYASVSRLWQADQLRHMFANQDVAMVGAKYREQLARDLQAVLRDVEPLKVEDDAVANAVTTVEVYDVDNVLHRTGQSGARFISTDDVVGAQLPVIPNGERSQPIALGAPRILVTRRVFNFGAAPSFPAFDHRETGPAGLDGHNRFEWESALRGVQTLTLTIPEPVVPAAQAQAYRDFVERMRANNGVSFPLGGAGAGTDDTGPGAKVWFIVIGVILAIGALSRCMGAAGG